MSVKYTVAFEFTGKKLTKGALQHALDYWFAEDGKFIEKLKWRREMSELCGKYMGTMNGTPFVCTGEKGHMSHCSFTTGQTLMTTPIQPSASDGERVEQRIGEAIVVNVGDIKEYSTDTELECVFDWRVDDRFPEGATVEIIARLVQTK